MADRRQDLPDNRGQKTFDDVNRLLFSRYGFHNELCEAPQVVQVLNELTGADFSDIFDRLIDGAGSLDLDWVFEDADNDQLWDRMEIQLDTDRTNPDIDGDGILDGVELEWGTNPTAYDERHSVYLPVMRDH